MLTRHLDHRNFPIYSWVGRLRVPDIVSAWRTWWRVILLGLLTVGAYGIVVYSFGVIISPVHEQTGWSVGFLSAAFTITSLIGGVASLGGGWLLDRVGARPVLLGSLATGGSCSCSQRWLTPSCCSSARGGSAAG